MDRFISNVDAYYAHLRAEHKETLIQHSELTMSYYKKLNKELGVEDRYRGLKLLIEACQIRMSDQVMHFATDLFENAIYVHDIGKINRNFQIVKMKNTKLGDSATEDTNHSIYSAVMFLDIFLRKIEEAAFSKHEKRIIFILWAHFAYVISRHHSYLKNLAQFQEVIEEALGKIENSPDIIGGYKKLDALIANKEKIIYCLEKAIRDVNKNSLICNKYLWFICKDLFASIVTADFYATGDYMGGTAIEWFGSITNVEEFTALYHQNELIRGIKTNALNREIAPINKLRSKMFMESEQNFLQNKDYNVFYLEAPTGCGKTLTSINLAVNAVENCKDIKRIFYVFPFNTLIEQTAGVLSDLFKEKDIAIANSIEAIKTKEDEDYSKSLLDYIMMHYPLILTSHVNFFGALVGASRESHLMFSHFKNSLVIIDEIQAYKNIIWKELSEMIHLAAELYNIKFIIMSATLPRISELAEAKSINLIEKPSLYFNDPLFKDRTKAHFELLDRGKIELDSLAKNIISQMAQQKERILIEFIDKVTSRQFYNLLLEKNNHSEYEIFELTGDDPIYYRQELIKKLKQTSADGSFILKKVVVIATQVIEAGVDIDMSIGYKDISLVDAEEQFAGRINRSCKRTEAPLYFFDYYDEKIIYKSDVRSQYSLRDPEVRHWFNEKDYGRYFDAILNSLELEKQRFNQNNIQNFFDLINNLNFAGLQKYLRLIDQESITIYIPQRIDVSGELISGQQIWEQYTEIIENYEIPYPEKQILLSKLKKQFSYFTYNVKYLPMSYTQSIGERIYLLKEDEYITNGKFDRQAYNDANGKGIFRPEELII